MAVQEKDLPGQIFDVNGGQDGLTISTLKIAARLLNFAVAILILRSSSVME